MKVKTFLISSLTTLVIAASGCSMTRHYAVDNFDKYYSCEVQFSEDFKSDEITLYESGVRIAVRKHKEMTNINGELEHEIAYEFYKGDKKVGELSENKWDFGLVDSGVEGSPTNYFHRILETYYEMQQCERLLWEAAN